MSMNARLLPVAFTVAVVTLGTFGCGAPQNAWKPGRSPRVLAFFPPLYCFAANVVDPQAEVQTLMVENDPHHFDPTIQHSWLVRDADVFYTNGLGLDDRMVNQLKRGAGGSRVRIVPLGEKVPEKDRVALGNSTDPHVWLGIPQAIVMVEAIRDDLKKASPNLAKVYDDNAAAYVKKLQQIQADGEKAFAEVKPEQRKFISFHDSMQYFAKGFNLEVAGVVEIEPGEPPTPQQFEQLLKICKEKNVRVIVSEPHFDRDNAAQRLRDMLKERGIDGVEIAEFDPLETAPLADLDAGYYEKVMRQNIDNLAAKLKKAGK
jgi:ABC-type Zn uptake system ZnuABC Zn-binding protein ZnuA